eukprot:11962944-Alexandrium_andersonii.AAC.1
MSIAELREPPRCPQDELGMDGLVRRAAISKPMDLESVKRTPAAKRWAAAGRKRDCWRDSRCLEGQSAE